jgi:hypothetical protein
MRRFRKKGKYCKACENEQRGRFLSVKKGAINELTLIGKIVATIKALD